MIPEVSRCTEDILSQILKEKTVDCGKTVTLYIIDIKYKSMKEKFYVVHSNV